MTQHLSDVIFRGRLQHVGGSLIGVSNPAAGRLSIAQVQQGGNSLWPLICQFLGQPARNRRLLAVI